MLNRPARLIVNVDNMTGITPLTEFEQRFERLLGDAFLAIQQKDQRARIRNPVHQRHRLAVLMDVVQKWESGIRKALPLSPLIALAELQVTLQLFEYWSTDPLWTKLISGLRKPADYAHTLLLLGFLSHTRGAGLHATVQPEGSERTCDLRVGPLSDVEINVELKVPTDLIWQREPLTPAKALKDVKRLLRSAGTGEKDQLPPPAPGMLVIGGLSFDKRTRDLLESAGERHFMNPPGDYSHILGFLYFWIGHTMDVLEASMQGNRIKMNSRLDTLTQVHLVKNPFYTGPVDLNLVDRPFALPRTEDERPPSH